MMKLLTFLFEHREVIEEIERAVAAGATKDAIKVAIRRTLIDVSDAAMEKELGPL